MLAADKTPVWKDPSVNQVNREPRRAHFFAFENSDKARSDCGGFAHFKDPNNGKEHTSAP